MNEHSPWRALLREKVRTSECSLTMLINFICSKDFDEIRTMRPKCNNVEIMMGNEAYESIKELFESLAQITTRIKKIWGSESVFDGVDFLH